MSTPLRRGGPETRGHGHDDGAGWDQARAAAHAAGTPAAPSLLPLEACAGLTLAADLAARIPVPHYASSAMDGWAVAGEGPWQLAEAPPGGRLEPGQAVPVVTGGLMPDGASAVLRSEYGSVRGGLLVLGPDVAAGEPPAGRHIRPAGEETLAGETVVAAGTVLNPAHLAIAAVCGHDALPVIRRPEVALLLTGDEVVTAGIPGPGKVRDTFGPALPAMVARLGGVPAPPVRLPDDFGTLLDAVRGCGADVVVTTGGTGHSPADHLRPVLAELGARILVPSIRMRPGHPALLAGLPDGRLLVGLPGNPLAAIMALLTLGAPLLAGFNARPLPPLGSVPAGARLAPLSGRDRLVPYTLTAAGAVPVERAGSAMMRGLAGADGVAVVPAAGAAAGDLLRTLPLPW